MATANYRIFRMGGFLPGFLISRIQLDVGTIDLSSGTATLIPSGAKTILWAQGDSNTANRARASASTATVTFTGTSSEQVWYAIVSTY